LIGFLQIGQVFRNKPATAHFATPAKMADEWGSKPIAARFKRPVFQAKWQRPPNMMPPSESWPSCFPPSTASGNFQPGADS
jgi:hypothetical protein